MTTDDNALAASRGVLRFLITANWAFGAGVLAMLVTSFAAEGWFSRALGIGADKRLPYGGRIIMIVGILAVPITNVVLTRLLSIVDSVRAGDPFVTRNAERLQTIAWAVAGLELSRLLVAGVAKAVSSPERPLDIRWNLSVTPWLAVMMLFVLARVFEHGARMREELEATV